MRPLPTCSVSCARRASRSRSVASTFPTRASASARPATRGRGAGSAALGMGTLLDLEHLAVDLVGDADAARFRQRAGVFLDQHRAVHRAPGAVGAERTFRARGAKHALWTLLEEHGLEVLRGL